MVEVLDSLMVSSPIQVEITFFASEIVSIAEVAIVSALFTDGLTLCWGSEGGKH